MNYKHLSLILASLLAGIVLYGQNIEKLSEENVDKEKVKLAHDFADRFFCAGRDGRTYEFQDDAIPALIQGLTPEIQNQVFQDIKSKFGEYKSLEYAETWKLSGGQNMTIVRFRGNFTEGVSKPEIRVIIDEANKVAGFWYKTWEDELK